MAGSSAWCVSLPRKSLRVNLISHNFLASAVFLTLFLATSDSKPTLEDDFTMGMEISDDEVVNYDKFRNYSTKLADALDPVFYEFNFDPVHLEKKLIRTAHSSYTSPKQFQLELQWLVQCYGPKHVSTGTNCWHIPDIERKYSIDVLPPPSFVDPPTIYEEYQFPNTTTYTRLKMMFPQYLRFHYMKLDREHFNPACQQLDEVLPKVMKYPEFAGFLLTSDYETLQISRIKQLIRVYLYWQFCNVAPDDRTEEHFEKIKKMTLKRIGASRLPNADRVRFLRANDILPRDDGKWEKEPKMDEKYLKPIESLPILVRNAAECYLII